MSDKVGGVCPESTLESANRRNFVRKALATAAAVGVGGALLANSTVPESSASSAACSPTYCNVYANGSVYVDYGNTNNGTCPDGGLKPGLIFGNCPCCSGQGISSNRTKGCVNGCDNKYGLDFYTGRKKWMSITNSGRISMGGFPSGCTRVGITAGCCKTGLWAHSSKCCGAGLKGVSVIKKGTGYGVWGVSCTPEGTGGVGVFGCSHLGVGVEGRSCLCAVVGVSTCGNGVVGQSRHGFAVWGSSSCGTAFYGTAGDIGLCVEGGKIGVRAVSGGTGVPLVAKGGCSSQTGPLQEWQNYKGCVLSVVTHNGSMGIGVGSPQRKLCVGGTIHASCKIGVGTQTINTTLAVNGSVSAKVVTKSSNYCMGASDFAVLASGSVTIKPPKASTQSGMIVFVKNVGTGTVTVTPLSGCQIDLSTCSITLTPAPHPAGVELISDGTTNWYVLSNAT
jgi:hypothetical protein